MFASIRKKELSSMNKSQKELSLYIKLFFIGASITAIGVFFLNKNADIITLGLVTLGGLLAVIGRYLLQMKSLEVNKQNQEDIISGQKEISNQLLGGNSEPETGIALVDKLNTIIVMYKAKGKYALENCTVSIYLFMNGKAQQIHQGTNETLLTAGGATQNKLFQKDIRNNKFHITFMIISKKHRWDNSYRFTPINEGWKVEVEKKKDNSLIKNYEGTIKLVGTPDRIM